MALKSLKDAAVDSLTRLTNANCPDGQSHLKDYLSTLLFAPITDGYDEIREAVLEAARKYHSEEDPIVRAVLKHISTEKAAATTE